VKEALEEIAKEQSVSMSELLNHAVIVMLAGLGKLPVEAHWRLDKYVKPTRKLNNILPAVPHWPDLIGKEVIMDVECRRW